MGHSKKRKEDARFIQGKGNYVDDVKLPGMVYMDIVRSPYAYAKIKKIDASKALAIPGVLAVVTGVLAVAFFLPPAAELFGFSPPGPWAFAAAGMAVLVVFIVLERLKRVRAPTLAG